MTKKFEFDQIDTKTEPKIKSNSIEIGGEPVGKSNQNPINSNHSNLTENCLIQSSQNFNQIQPNKAKLLTIIQPKIEQKLNKNWTKIEQKLNKNWTKIEQTSTTILPNIGIK